MSTTTLTPLADVIKTLTGIETTFGGRRQFTNVLRWMSHVDSLLDDMEFGEDEDPITASEVMSALDYYADEKSDDNWDEIETAVTALRESAEEFATQHPELVAEVTQMPITVQYESIDGYSRQRTFKRLESAREFAHHWINKPDLGSFYAVSFDGIGKITVWGGATLQDLYPEVAS